MRKTFFVLLLFVSGICLGQNSDRGNLKLPPASNSFTVNISSGLITTVELTPESYKRLAPDVYQRRRYLSFNGVDPVTGQLPELLTTPSGIKYHKFGNGPDVLIYMDGYSSNPNPLGSAFYKNFLPHIQSRVTAYLAIPLPSTAWEKPWNGTLMGTDFLNFVADQHPDARIFVTGFSGGGDSGYIYGAKKVTAFASVAGSDLNNYNRMMTWRTKGIPVWAFIGTNDTSENSRANCEKTWINWFDPVGDLKLTYVTGGHSSVPQYAYNPANGLWEWFASIGTPISPVLKENLKSAYFSEGFLYVELESGKVLRFKPDE